MSHLTLEELYAAVLDSRPLASEAEQHLVECTGCRRLYGDLSVLAHELALARAGAVTPEAIERYAALFSHVQQNPTKVVALWRSFTALLAWDSRLQPAREGVRSVAAMASYRLLFASDKAELELLVERDGHLFRVNGEIVTLDGQPPAPARIQWSDQDGTLHYESQSGADGQFAMRGIAQGRYQVAVVFESGDRIDIEAVEIT